jgi:hypothetical protein
MKQSASISIVFSLMLAGTSFATASNWESTTTLAAEAKPDNCEPVGRIANIEGLGLLKREAWNEFYPTVKGTKLCLGDRIKAAPGAKIIIQCTDPNQPPWTVSNGETQGAAKGCPKPETPRYGIDGPTVPMRTETARRIPYIISPPETARLNDKPKLRWIAVEGATSYNVRVSGSGVDWKTDVSTTQVVYSGQQPLKPSVNYLLTVNADNGEKADETVFFLLDEKKAQPLRDAAFAIAKQNLPDEAKALALADLYIEREFLIPDAIDLLEPLAAKGSQTAPVYHTLGNLYAVVGLFSQAEKYYSKAVELATTAKDIEGQAAAAVRLGEVYNALGNSDSAIAWFKKAQNGYQQLGDMQRVRKLEQQQSEIEKTRMP